MQQYKGNEKLLLKTEIKIFFLCVSLGLSMTLKSKYILQENNNNDDNKDYKFSSERK